MVAPRSGSGGESNVMVMGRCVGEAEEAQAEGGGREEEEEEEATRGDRVRESGGVINEITCGGF